MMHHAPVRHYVSLLTAQEVSVRLGVPLPKLYELAAKGRIPAVRVGRHWRFPRRLLEAWQRSAARATKPATQSVLPLVVLIV